MEGSSEEHLVIRDSQTHKAPVKMGSDSENRLAYTVLSLEIKMFL